MNKMSVHPADVEGLIEQIARLLDPNAFDVTRLGFKPSSRVARREVARTKADQILSLLSQERATVGGDSSGAERAEPASLSRSAVVPEAEQAGGWRPIESAPRDGTWILAHGDGDGWENCSFVCQAAAPGSGSAWVEVPGDWDARPAWWRPLPEPPEWRCPSCGAQVDERWDYCAVHAATGGEQPTPPATPDAGSSDRRSEGKEARDEQSKATGGAA